MVNHSMYSISALTKVKGIYATLRDWRPVSCSDQAHDGLFYYKHRRVRMWFYSAIGVDLVEPLQ